VNRLITAENWHKRRNLERPTGCNHTRKAPPAQHAAAFELKVKRRRAPGQRHLREKTATVPALFAGFLGWTLDAFDCSWLSFSDGDRSGNSPALMRPSPFSITLTLMFVRWGVHLWTDGRFAMASLPLMIDCVSISVVEVATGFATVHYVS